MRKLGIRGLSVTSPHKIAFARKIRQLAPIARRAGAVNTVLHAGGELLGFNTDAEGFMRPLRERIEPAGKTAVILGAGGAARAVALALHDAGAAVLVCTRRERPGKDLARLASGRWVAPRALARETYDILINATPVGRDGRSMPVSAASVKGALVADLNYGPVETPLLAAARARGIPTVGGLEILLAQGIEQYTLFTGREAPVEVMREALLAASSGRPMSGLRHGESVTAEA
jgi:shikimate dehydrogenase